MSVTLNSNSNTSSDVLSDYERAKSILSIREWDILERIGDGFSAREISYELFLSIHTVQTHIRAIKHKLNLRGYRAVVVWYRKIKPNVDQ